MIASPGPRKHRVMGLFGNTTVAGSRQAKVIGLALAAWAGCAHAQVWPPYLMHRVEARRAAGVGSRLVQPAMTPANQPTGQPEARPAPPTTPPSTPVIGEAGGQGEGFSARPTEPAAAESTAAPAPAAPQADSPVSRALARLLDVSLPEADRVEAARSLSGLAWTEEGRLAILGLLNLTAEDQSPKVLLIRGLAREPWLPETLLPALTEVLRTAEGDRIARVLNAIASMRTPPALRLVADHLDPARPEATRTAAHNALVRATGRDDLAGSQGVWLDWINRTIEPAQPDASAPGGPGMMNAIVRALADRAERQSTRARDLATRLTESQRRLYMATLAPQRPALLATMLKDDVAEVRSLGFELVERELVSAPTPGEEVIAAIVELLRSPTAAVRAQAAGLLGRIAPEGVGEAVAAALNAEQDPAAAAALLTAASRWPNATGLREPVLRWLENGPGTRPVASEAALSMQRAGVWNQDDLARILAAMRRVAPTDLTPAGCRLIAAIGTDDDRQGLAELLLMGSAPQRSAVADALTGRREHVDAILAAADRDPSLIPVAARTVAAARANLEGFRSIARLPAPDEATRRAALQTVGEALSTGAMLSAADHIGRDTPTVIWLLERALARSQAAVAAGEPGAIDLLRESAERLARQRLELGRPAEAITALDAAGEATSASRLNALRAVAFIVLGRVEDARRLNAAPEAWLEGLERVIGQQQAAEVVRVIREDMIARLDPAQTQRLETLAARIQAAQVPPG